MNTDNIIGNIKTKVSIIGNTPGVKGDTGNGIDSIILNDDYTLTINYTDGSYYKTTSIRGKEGPTGAQGIQGEKGLDGAIQYTAGSGIKIEGNKISSTLNDGRWGNIKGNIENQSDLIKIINLKANSNDVPTKVSELENDSDFITANGDVITTLQNKKAEIIELLNVTDTVPETCSIGDKYYNITTNKIYTAIADNTWESTGDDPSSVFLYVDLTNSKLWFYDGTYFKPYGGGSGGSGDSLPIGSIVEYDGTTPPTGYEEVEEEKKILWTNENPNNAMSSGIMNFTNDDYDIVEIFFLTHVTSEKTIESVRFLKGYNATLQTINRGGGHYIREFTRVSDSQYSYSDGYTFTGYASGKTQTSNVCVPLYAVGYKTNLF